MICYFNDWRLDGKKMDSAPQCSLKLNRCCEKGCARLFGLFFLEGGELLFELADAFLHLAAPVVIFRAIADGRFGFARFGEEMPKGLDAPTLPRRDALDEWSMGIVDEASEDFLNLRQVLKGVQALAALFELAGGLSSSQEKDGQDGTLAVAELENVGELVLILGRAPPEDFGDEFVSRKKADCLAQVVGGVVGDGVAG